MANTKRTYDGVYNSLKQISDEEGVDFGLDGMSQEQFKEKYFTGPGNIENLYNRLSEISDEEGIDFGQGSRDEWLSSFGYKRNTGNDQAKYKYLTLEGRRVGGKPSPSSQQVLNDAQQTLNENQRVINRIGNQEQRMGLDLPQEPIRLGQNRKVTKGQPRFNMNTGKMENTYVTPSGNEYESRELADLEQNAIDQAEWERNNPKQALKNRIDSQINGIDSRMEGYEGQWVDADGRVHYSGGSAGDEAMRNLENARHDLIEARQQMERTEQLHKSSDFLGGIGIPFTKDFFNNWKNFGYAVWDRLSDVGWWEDALSGGVNDLEKAGAYMKIKNKLDSGQQLTDQEMDVVLAGMATAQAQQYTDLPMGYKAGEITADMAPFMAQMAVNPASGFGRALARQAVRRYGRNGIAAVSKRVAARVLGNLGEAAVLSNTLQAPRTIGNVLQRNTGDSFMYDEDGNVHMGRYEDDENGEPVFVEGGKGALRSAYEGEVSSIIENFTELGAGGSVNKFVKRMANSKAGRALGIGYLSDLVGKVGSTPFAKQMKKFMERTHWDGMIEEPLEEEYGIILNSILGTGDNKISDLLDSEQQAQIFAGTLWFGGMMSAMNTAAYPLYRRQLKQQIAQADINGQIAFGEEWELMKDAINNMDDNEVGNYLYSIKDDEAFNAQQRAALFDYAARLKQQQGSNVGDMLMRMEGNLSQLEKTEREAYETGAEAETPDEKKRYVEDAVAAELNLSNYGKEFALLITTQKDNPANTIDYLLSRRDLYTDEQIEAAADYYQKQARAYGVLYAAEDAVNTEVERANAEVRANTHQGTGNVVTVQDNDGEYYVLSGDIDPTTGQLIGTGGAMVVKDIQTGKVSVKSPQQLAVTSVSNADDLIQQNETTLREQLTQQADDDITYGSPANEVYDMEDTVTLQDGQGGTIEGQVVGLPNAVDGVYVVQTSDGRALQMTADELNRRIINHNGVEVKPVEAQPQPAGQGAAEAQQPGEVAEQAQQAVQPTEAKAETEPSEQQQSALSRIPVRADASGQPVKGKNGRPVLEWHKASVEDAAAALVETTGGDMLMARDTATDLINRSKEKLEKIRKQKPKGDDPMEIAESRMEIKRQEKEQQDIIKQWQNVNQHIQNLMHEEEQRRTAEREAAKSEEQRQREAEEARIRKEQQDEQDRKRLREQIERDREKRNREYEPLTQAKREMADNTEAMSILEDVEPRSLEEWVSSQLRPHSMLWQDASDSEIGLQTELGMKRADMQRMMSLLGTKESGAKPFGQVVLDIYEGLPEGLKQQYNDQDIRNTLLNLFNEGSSTRMLHLTEEHRIEEARQMMKETERREAEAEMEAWADAYHLTPEERETFEDYLATPPSLIEQEIIDQIILEYEEQNRRSQTMDQQPVSRTDAAGIEGGEGQVRQESETAGAGTDEETVAQGAEAATGQPSVADNNVPGTARDREALAVLFDQIGASPILAGRMSDYDVEQLTAMVEDWEIANDEYGQVIEQKKSALKSKNKETREAAQKAIDDAQEQANAVFEPIEEYIEGLNVKYGIESEEPFEGAIPTPQIDKPRYDANRQALIDAYKSGDPAAITQAAQAIQQYIDEGLDAGEDHTEMFDIAEDYDGNDPEKLADQYIIRTFWGRYLDNDTDQEYIKTGLKPEMRESKQEGEDPLKATVLAARNGDVEAQEKLNKYGISWEKKPVVRFISQGELDSIMAGNRYEGRFGNGRVDVTNQPEVTTAASADYRVTFKDELDWTLSDRLQMKNEQLGDGWLMGGYGLEDVATIEKRNSDGTYSVVYNATASEKKNSAPDNTTDTGKTSDRGKRNDTATPQSTVSESKDTNNSGNNQENLGKTSSAEEISTEEAKVDTNPSEAQKEAGNYQKGHINIDGYDITIENPKGSIRRGTDASGKSWETEMHNTYGYIRGTEGVDGDHIDVFLSDNPTSGSVFVVDQINPTTGEFDEHKVMYGFASEEEARAAYLSNYSKGWKGLGQITEVSREEFKKWVESSHRKTKPFAEYKSVKKAEAQESEPDGLGVRAGRTKSPKASDKKEHKRLVSDDKMEELRKQLLAKMNNANVGIDPERMLLGAMYAVGKIERGFTKFADYAQEMVNDLGDMIRPYLKSFYNAVRDMPEAQEYADQMDDYDTVQKFDVFNFDKGGKVPTVFEKAEQVAKEQKVKRDAKKVKQQQPDLFAGDLFGEAQKPVEKKEQPKHKTAWWSDPNRPQSLDPSDYRTYTTDEAKAYFAQFKSEDGKTDFTKWAHPNLAYITAAAWDGAKIPYEEIKNIPEIAEAEKIVKDAEANGKLEISDDDVEQLAKRLLSQGKAKQERKALLIVGLPAGGKSSVFANPLAEQYDARIIDSDDVKPWLDGYDGGNGAGYVQDASAKVAERAIDLAAQNGDNIIIPRIGGNSAYELAAALRLAGYDVQLYFNDVSGVTSIDRAASRFAQTGRYLSLDYLTKKANVPSEKFSKFAEQTIGNYLDERTEEEVQNIRRRLQRLRGELYGSGSGLRQSPTSQRGREESSEGAVQESLGRGELFAGGSDVSILLNPLFTYVEWKSNDVAFGEKPKEIWNSKSGKPMPTKEGKDNDVRSEQRLSRESSPSGEGERQEGRGTGRVREGLGSKSNRNQHIGPEHSVTNESAQPKQAPKHNNKRNNSGERGKDYAPTSPKARFNANVAAIKMMRELIDQGIEAPTKDQMEVLRQYSGWGGLGTFFNDESSAENKILRDLLDDEEYNAATLSIKTAYYTPAYIIDSLWDIAKAMGFKGGNVLEGSAGIGNIIQQMPNDMSRQSDIEAVEIDKISGNILKLLYPDAKVHIQGFQDTVIRNGSVDLAITNVPFAADLSVIDKVDKDLSRRFRTLHDFCIAKNIRKLKDGGIGIFITTSGTMDKSNDLRAWITDEGQADVVGAFRMNNETFGGTKVTSDIIVVRKRVGGNPSEYSIDVSKASPIRVGTYKDKFGNDHQTTMVVNDYFKEHPEMMAGEMAFAYEKGETFRPGSYALYPSEGKNQEKMMADFVKSMKGKEEVAVTQQPAQQPKEPNQLTAVKEGRMLIDDNGRICVSRLGEAVPLGLNDQKVKGQTKQQCFKDYQAVQAAVDDVLQQQLSDPNDEALKPKLAALNKAYDLFTKRYGTLHKNTAISFLRNDVDFPSFQALEIYKEEKDIKGKVTVKTSKPKLFTERVIGFKTEPQPKTVKDAVIASIFRTNGIDLEWIAAKLSEVAAPPNGGNWTAEDVRKGILVSRLGFEDPSTGQLEIRYKYLSGNVREKLAIAEQYNAEGETSGRYAANVEELKKVVPMDIPAHLIDFSLGSSWIPVDLYKDFVKETLDLDNIRITHLEGSWAFDEGYGFRNEKNRAAGIYSEKFRETIYGHQLVAAALNNRPVKVAKQVSEGYGSSKTTRTVVDEAATQACAVRVDEIKDEFKTWAKKKMQEDQELGRRIEKLYNDKFNALVPMEVGEEFLPERFDGANTGITLRPHQKLGAIKGLISPVMLAHEVGTGKSFTLITTAMEMRRLGTAKKPMIVVQNATVAQMTADVKLLYPNAKVLSLSEQDRDAEGRRAFYAKIKYNDWDIIIVPQSTFERIPDSPERELQFIQEKIDEKKHVIEAAQAAGVDNRDLEKLKKELEKIEQEYGDKYLDSDPSNDANAPKRKKKDAKREAASLDKAETRAKEQLDRATDDVQFFDDLGVDALLVDEAHEYKHLGFQTSIGRGIKGIDPSYSKKCAGLYNKTRSVFEKAGWKNVVFATGTPISNTAAEIWTFMKYLMPADVMKANDIYYFDDFVHNFGNISQMLEFTTSGKFKENTRFAAYVNKPELIRIWSQVADTVLSKETEVKDKEPDVEGGKDQDVFLPQSPSLIRIMAAVRAELERFENMTGQQKKENSSIPLTMYGIAKRAAIDPRLVDAEAPDEPMSKTNAAVKEIVKDLKATQSYKGTVAVFCDNQNRLGTNTAGKKVVEFNIYDDMKEKLIKAGVPEKQIAIVKSGMSIAAKQKIFDAVNSGDIRVVLGSTQTLGTGVNMQERLHLLIHMDAPDRPMDYTQRNGRIKRQGNLHKQWGKTIRIVRFGVEDSLDVTAYQRLKTKSGFINSIMDGKGALANNQVDRTVEEEEEGLFDNPVAVLSGSQYALKKNQAERELRKYQGKKAQWEADQIYVTNQLRYNDIQVKATEANIQEEQKKLDRIKRMFPDGTVKTITVEGVKIDMTKNDGAKKLGDALKEKINDPVNAIVKRNRENAIYNDESLKYTISLDGHDVNFTVDVTRESVWDNGRMKTVIHKFTSYTMPDLNIDSMASSRGVRDYLDEIIDQVVTGQDSQDRIDAMQKAAERIKSETEQIKQREGMPFQFAKELEEAIKHVDEYTELMKKEMEEKEAKYAAQQKEAEADGNGFNLNKAEESEEEDDDVRYSADEDVDPTTTENFKAWFGDWENDPEHASKVVNEDGTPKVVYHGTNLTRNNHSVPFYEFYPDSHFGTDRQARNRIHRYQSKEAMDFDMRLGFPMNMEQTKIYPVFLNIKNPMRTQDVPKYWEETHSEWWEQQIALAKREGYDGIAYENRWEDPEHPADSYIAFYPEQIKSVDENMGTYNINDPDIRHRLTESFEDGETHPIKTTFGYSTFNVLGRNTTYSSDLMPDEYGTKQSLLDAVRTMYPDYYVRIEDNDLVFDSWNHVMQSANVAEAQQQTQRSQAHRSYIERKTQNAINAVTTMAERMGLDVEVLATTDGLTGKKARAKGWFNSKTGKITLVLPNHSNQFDLVNTLLHEGVAHFGLRKMFGQNFDTFLDNVYNNVSPEIKARIDAAIKRNGWSRHEATEEYLARLAERTDFEQATESGWWQKIKDFFMNMLAQAGFNTELTDNELRYILWRSYDNLLHPDRKRNIFDIAKDVEMKRKLGIRRERERERLQRTGRADTSWMAAEAEPHPTEQEQDVKELFGELQQRYNSAPIVYASLDMPDVDLLKAVALGGMTAEDIDGVSEESIHKLAEMLREKVKKEKTIGRYDPITKKINIFAPRVTRTKAREVFFHENIHALLDKAANAQFKSFIDDYWQSAPETVNGIRKDFIERKYEPEEHAEEFFAYTHGKALAEGTDLNELYNDERGNQQTKRQGKGVLGESHEGTGRNGQEERLYQSRGRDLIAYILGELGYNEEQELFSLRTKEPPKKTGIGYKVFVLKDGQLYPPMVANPNGEGTPVGVWLDADTAPVAGTSKTGRPQVKAGGKGTQGGSGQLAYRPGWHLGTIPYALQFGRKDENGERTLFPNNFVWAEVEYADDVDYQDEARQEGINANGKYQHSLAGLKHVPTDGSYKYRTNPDPRTDEWIITGAMRVNKILTREEVDELVRKAGREPQQIQDGDIVTDEAVKELNEEIKATREADEMGLLYRDDEAWTDGVAQEAYEKAVAQDSLKWQEAWQDSMAGLKAIQDAIAKETGNVATGAEDAYRFENRMHGRAKNMAERYDWQYYRPMLKAFNDFCKEKGMTHEQGLDYLIAKSGLERNMYYAFRDAMKEKLTEDIKKEREKLEKDYAKNRIDEAEYKHLKAELEEQEQTGVDDAIQQLHETLAWQRAREDYEHGDITYDELIRRREALIRSVVGELYDKHVKDYSGLTETFAKSSYDYAQSIKKEAQQAIDPTEKRMLWAAYDKAMKEAYEEAYQVAVDDVFNAESDAKEQSNQLWERINAATKETLKHSYESGLMDRKTYQKVGSMFDYYLPLRGWDEDKASDVYTYMGKENVFSPAVKKTWGRTSKSENPLAYIGNIAMSTILSGHRNQMKQHFLNYVMNNPTSLVNISESWYENIGNEGESPVWVLRSADTAGKSADEIVDIVNDFNEEMRLKQRDGKAIPVTGRLRLDVHATSGQKAEHVVEVQRAGHTYQLYINGDPKAAQALNGSAARAVSRISDTWLGKKITTINRSMAEFFTSKNPAFIISNLSRDLNMAGASVAVNEGAEYNARFIANAAKVLSPRIATGDVSKLGLLGLVGRGRGVTGMMPKLMRKYQDGKLNTRNETERYFKEFMEEGGETGFVNMLSVDSFKEKMQKEIGQMNGSTLFGSKAKVKETSISKAMRLLGDTFEFYNRCAEDATRFIVYMTSRQMGKTLEESIADAKDVTLNFNRKGTGEKGNAEVRDLFIFVNPAIQALANMYRMAKGHPLKFGAVTTAFITVGALMPVINNWLLNLMGDDDDKDAYWNLPPWVRKNNLVFWVPGTKSFVTIPLAQEFRVFYGVGEMLSSVAMEHPVDKWGLEVFSSVADLVPINPTGNGGNLMVDFAPTMVQPLMQIGENIDFTGRPIWRENQGNKFAPMYTKAYVSTPKWMTKISEGINDLTGGNEGKKGAFEKYSPIWGEYINNPAVWNHLLQGYFGGMYNTISKGFDVGVTAASGEMPKVYQTPIINRFLNRPVERDNAGVLGDDYYHMTEQRDALQYELKIWKKKAADAKSSGDTAAYETAQEHVDEIQSSEEWKRAEVINHYEKIIKDLKAGEKAAEGEDKQDIKRSISLYKQQMMEELAAIDDGKDPMEAAMEQFNKATSLSEKQKLKLRIERLTKGDTKKPADSKKVVEKALSYQQTEPAEARNTGSDLYLELATAENVRDDARIKAAKALTKPYTQHYKELTDAGKYQEAAKYRHENLKWFIVSQSISSHERAIANNRKLLGKGNKKAIMRIIDSHRNAMLGAIDKLNK